METASAALLAVSCGAGPYLAKARILSQSLKLPLSCAPPEEMPASHYVLYVNARGVSLCMTGRAGIAPIRVSFTDGAMAYRRCHGGGANQLVARAVGLKNKRIRRHRPLSVVDLTAGLGQDGFVLASLGCYVTLVERCPSIYQLLCDGLERARESAASPKYIDGKPFADILTRINLLEAEAKSYLTTMAQQTDIIYLDPMFPKRRQAAQVNKGMQALQAIVGDDADAGELLSLALTKARFRVVVKRPRKAPALHRQYPQIDLPEPQIMLRGKSTRYDIYPSASGRH